MISLKLPYPPTSNHIHTVVRGRKILSTAARAYYKVVAIEVLMQLGSVPELTGRLNVRIIATMPDKRRRDLSNLIKVTEDAMQKAGVYKDDSQIDNLQIIRSAVEKPGWLDIEIIQTKDIS